MKYKVKIFDGICSDSELEKYLNDYCIKPEQIISISFACDSKATERWGQRDVQQILLVYVESVK